MIHALTLVIRDKNLNPNMDNGILARLKGTMRDVNEVDRAVYINADGVETYIKDRYPSEHVRFQVVEHRVERPSLVAYGFIESWVDELRNIRKDLALNNE